MADFAGSKSEHSPVVDAPSERREEASDWRADRPPPERKASRPAERESADEEAATAVKPTPREISARESASLSDAVADLWARVADVDPISYYWEEPPEVRSPADGEPSAEDTSPLFPVRRPLYKRSEPTPSAEEELTNVISFLQRLQATVRRAASQSDKPSPVDAGQSVLQAKRLSRTGVTPDHFQIGVLPKTWSSFPAEGASKPDPQTAADDPEAEEPRRDFTVPTPTPTPEPVRAKSRLTPWLVFLGGLVLAALGLAVYLWSQDALPWHAEGPPRNQASHAKPAATPGAEPSEEALNTANLALEAMQGGDLRKASDLLAAARKQGAVMRGFYYQAALLAYNQGQLEEADNFLNQSIEANEAVADCWYLRANASFAAAGPAQAAEQFEEATHAAPFDPRYYFFRAECLRRHGNTAEALAQFQQALKCRPSSVDTELILFKIGMTKLESNTDLIFKTELRDRLSHEPVAGDTLLLGAADAISRNEYAEAADDLRRAALVLPPRTFQSRVRDYVFRAQSKQPDIAAALKSSPPVGGPASPAPVAAQKPVRVLVDPATRSMAEADPAGW